MLWFLRDKRSREREKIDEISSILFPPLEKVRAGGTTYFVDHSADANLDAALLDMADENVSESIRKTVKRVSDDLLRTRLVLESYRDLRRVKYYSVETAGDSSDERIASIVATPDNDTQ